MFVLVRQERNPLRGVHDHRALQALGDAQGPGLHLPAREDEERCVVHEPDVPGSGLKAVGLCPGGEEQPHGSQVPSHLPREVVHGEEGAHDVDAGRLQRLSGKKQHPGQRKNFYERSS